MMRDAKIDASRISCEQVGAFKEFVAPDDRLGAGDHH